jgi:hypothetical protein
VVSPERLTVGDRVTVRTSDSDPIEISLHRHAVVIAADGGAFMVGHPGMSQRRYGPYSDAQLVRGWDTP